jgi:DNA-binding NarL/FixJ family response regulator
MSGRDALKKIREINPDVPVIIASGLIKQEVPGASGYLQKPFRVEALYEAIGTVFQKKQP